jgi:uncharacterized protein YjbJ (UPF0337 family)
MSPGVRLFIFIHHHSTKGIKMNWDRIEGNWKQFKGSAKQQWGKLTDDQLDVIAGRRDQLAGKIQEIYGIAQDEAESQLAHWQKQQKDIADSSN